MDLPDLSRISLQISTTFSIVMDEKVIVHSGNS